MSRYIICAVCGQKESVNGKDGVVRKHYRPNPEWVPLRFTGATPVDVCPGTGTGASGHEDYVPEARPRGLCPDCGREVSLNRDGSVRGGHICVRPRVMAPGGLPRLKRAPLTRAIRVRDSD